MAFEYHKQPYKAVYLSFTVFSILFRLPFWSLRYLLPQTRPRRSWSLAKCINIELARAFVNTMWRTALMSSDPPEKAAQNADTNGFVWVDAAPELVVGEIKMIAELNGVPAKKTCGFWYGSNGNQPASENEKVVYFMFGGGFVLGTANPADGGMRRCIDGMLENFPCKPRLFAIEYRVSSAYPFQPANPFPAALIDAVAGYKYLVQSLGFKPENIIISGLSAGGLLAFWLARYLAINQFPQLPNAGGLVLFSPTVDWANTRMGPESSMKRNPDFVYTILDSGYTLRALMGNIDIKDAASNHWMAPGSAILNTKGLFVGIPKTCIVAGEAEQTLDGMIALRDNLIADIGESQVKYLEYPDATHDLAITGAPERLRAMLHGSAHKYG